MEDDYEQRDQLARILFGDTLMEATVRVIGGLAVAALVFGTLGWLVG